MIEPGLATLRAGLPWGRCKLDGMRIDCLWAMELRASTSAVQCPNNNCGPIPVVYQGRREWASFRAFGDGYHGYVPHHAKYMGNGYFAPFGAFARNSPPRLEDRSQEFDTNFAELNGATGERLLARRDDWLMQDITGKEKETLIRDIQDLTARPACKKFLEGLFKAFDKVSSDEPPVASDILGVFDMIDDQEGFVRVNPEKLKGKGGYFSTVAGTVADGTASILLNGKGGSYSVDLVSMIHEAFHQAGRRYDDRRMAQAVYQYRLDQKLTVMGIHHLPEDANDEWANSAYWGKYLAAACSPEFNK